MSKNINVTLDHMHKLINKFAKTLTGYTKHKHSLSKNLHLAY